MRRAYWVFLVILALTGSATRASADDLLGSASSFAVLGGSTVASAGSTVVNGSMGVWPGTAIVGLPPGIVNGGVYPGDEAARHAQRDVARAYNTLEAMSPRQDLSGRSLGGMTLTPGVYSFSSPVELSGLLTLDAQHDPGAAFVFQIHSSLTTARNASVVGINGGDACNVYWLVSRSAILGASTAFWGNILAGGSITMHTGATITNGRALARAGTVRLDGNVITAGASCPNPFTSSEISSWGQIKGGLVGTP